MRDGQTDALTGSAEVKEGQLIGLYRMPVRKWTNPKTPRKPGANVEYPHSALALATSHRPGWSKERMGEAHLASALRGCRRT